MKRLLLLAAVLGATLVGGCATYTSDGYGGAYYAYEPSDGYYVYEPWSYGYYGYEPRRGDGRHAPRYGYGGGRSEPGNEAGMYPGRPGDGRGDMVPGWHGRGQGGGGVGSGPGDARGGEAGR